MRTAFPSAVKQAGGGDRIVPDLVYVPAYVPENVSRSPLGPSKFGFASWIGYLRAAATGAFAAAATSAVAGYTAIQQRRTHHKGVLRRLDVGQQQPGHW